MPRSACLSLPRQNVFDALHLLPLACRHHKRRVVQPTLVKHLAALLPAGARVVMQSDEVGVALAMRTCFEQHGRGSFRPAGESDLDACRHRLSGAKFYGKSPPSAASTVQFSANAPQQSQQQEPFEEQGWHTPCLPVPSDREVICQMNGLPIFRTVLVRC